ncbi:hypothetical protein KQI63_12785 [bacterium]|nr:hypothetical protein [bacterium]
MASLLIEAAMVNPQGKSEKLNTAVSNEELNHEWVQIRNTSSSAAPLDDITLMHLTYPLGSSEAKQTVIMRLQGTLPGLTALRIHSGRGKPYYDQQLNVYHGFVNPKQSVYLFQVVRPDKLFLTRRGKTIDLAAYQVPVPVNKRLKRVSPAERFLLQPI